ncbi:MAG: IS1 family transposase [Alphaproteobacteria bacterium]|nr:MAG: IS1 family transposase [Alphaproteobacteria bacterium]
MERRATTPAIELATQCPRCESSPFVKNGKDRNGDQRYACTDCGRAFGDPKPAHPAHPMRIPVERALMCLNLLVEGMSIRSTERVTASLRLLRGGRRA